VTIDEIGDTDILLFSHAWYWSLGDYFKKEELPWLFEFLTKRLGLPVEKLYVTVLRAIRYPKRRDAASSG